MTPGTPILSRHTVVVRRGSIVALGPAGGVRVPGDALRVAGEGRYLIPGLADMHVHLEHFRGPELLKLFIANGVTTVRNMDGRPHILEWRSATAAGRLSGPAIFTAGPILDGDPPVLPDNTIVRTAEEARAAVAAQHSAGYDFVKVYTGLSTGAYHAVLAAARERRMPVAGHVPRGVPLAAALGGGQTVIEHLADYGPSIEADDSPLRGRWHWSRLFTAIPADPARITAVARDVARAGVWTVPTLLERTRAVAPRDTLIRWLAEPELAYIPAAARAQWADRVGRGAARMDAADWAVIARGRTTRRRLVRALHEAGAGILAGTDAPNPFVVPGFSLVEELSALVEAGLPPADALAAATSGAARFLDGPAGWGTVEVGKRADLVLLEANPLHDIRNVSRRAGVMVRGRWYPRAELDGMLAELRAREARADSAPGDPPAPRASAARQLPRGVNTRHIYRAVGSRMGWRRSAARGNIRLPLLPASSTPDLPRAVIRAGGSFSASEVRGGDRARIPA